LGVARGYKTEGMNIPAIIRIIPVLIETVISLAGFNLSWDKFVDEKATILYAYKGRESRR